MSGSRPALRPSLDYRVVAANAARCHWCHRHAVAFCDHPRDLGRGRCNAPVCGEHNTRLPINDDRCPDHRPKSRNLEI